MTKAILEFDMTEPEAVQSHFRCVKALDMSLALFELSRNLRRKCESVCENMPDGKDQFDGLDLVFSEISLLLEDYNINVDELAG